MVNAFFFIITFAYLHFGHVSEDAEDDEAGDEAGEAVDRASDDRVLNIRVTDPGLDEQDPNPNMYSTLKRTRIRMIYTLIFLSLD